MHFDGSHAFHIFLLLYERMKSVASKANFLNPFCTHKIFFKGKKNREIKAKKEKSGVATGNKSEKGGRENNKKIKRKLCNLSPLN